MFPATNNRISALAGGAGFGRGRASQRGNPINLFI
jgi:hypothetical protein